MNKSSYNIYNKESRPHRMLLFLGNTTVNRSDMQVGE